MSSVGKRAAVDLAGIEALAVDLTDHKQIESAVVTRSAVISCRCCAGPRMAGS
jgi:hypothetical protein